MRRFLVTILSFLLCLSCFSQKIVSYDNLNFLPEKTTMYEGFYSVISYDCALVGTTYAIIYYDDDSSRVSLVFPTNDEYPSYMAYFFDVKEHQITRFENGNIQIRNTKVSYSTYRGDDYTYVILKCRIIRHTFYYECVIYDTDFDKYE